MSRTFHVWFLASLLLPPLTACRVAEFNSKTERQSASSKKHAPIDLSDPKGPGKIAGPGSSSDPNSPTGGSGGVPGNGTTGSGQGTNPNGSGSNNPNDPNNPGGVTDPGNPGGGGNNPNNPGGSGNNPNNPGGSGNNPNNPGGGSTDTNNPPRSGGPNEVEQDFQLTCDGTLNPVRPVFEINQPKDTKVIANIRGELCPQTTNYLRVVFLIDFSASMGKHDARDPRVDGHPGHDPMINNSCGRYEAVKTIIDKLKPAAQSANLEVAMVPFAAGIVSDYEVAPVSYSQFVANQLKPENFCGFVLQDPYKYANEPGAIQPTYAYTSGTAYDPPFRRAEAILNEKSVRGLVYFITDGEPNDPESGRAAAKAVGQLPNTTVNSILLGHDAANARELLEELTPANNLGIERVKDVANADQLKVAITEFKETEIRSGSGKATLYIPPYETYDLGLISNAQNKTFTRKAAGVWQYEVQPFVLLGRPGEVVTNTVKVKGTGTDGSTYLSTVEIRYRMGL